MRLQLVLFVLFISTLTFSCKKWSDPAPKEVPGIGDRKYCNDPEAVNYNWGFPGVADSSICYYPVDIFKGTWLFTDSVYNDDNTLDSVKSLTTYTLEIVPLTTNQFLIKGFCTNGNGLQFTSTRSALHVSADSLIKDSDTSFNYGQFFCRTEDTLSGSITRSLNDSTYKEMYINLTVVSDTAINFHRGTAYKQ